MAKSTLRLIFKKRHYTSEQLDHSQLKRCMSRWDVTSLGLGSTLGASLWLVAGGGALQLAGPALVLSVLLAAVAALLAGLCYAEFASRIPRAGSAYSYTCVGLGEFVGFLVGWNIILESLFGAASIARGMSLHVDALTNGTMSGWFRSVAPIDVPFMATQFDMLAFFVVLIVGAIMVFGARGLCCFTKTLTSVTIGVIIFVIVAGAFRADPSNWSIEPSVVPDGLGSGGFFPYGAWGVVRGAAVCFYGFIGFDTISYTAEEVFEARSSVPFAIILVIVVTAVLYTSLSVVLTMMVPYYLQDNVTAISSVFSQVDMEWARWVVAVGMLFGILASLVGVLFSLPRLLYSMSSDRVIFGFLSIMISRRSPVLATILVVVIVAVLSSVLELNQLVVVMSVGSLLTYTAVAVSTISLRYGSNLKSIAEAGYMRQLFGCGERRMPTVKSANITYVMLFLYICTCVGLSCVGAFVLQPLIPLTVLHVVAAVLIIFITLQPTVKQLPSFKTPLVPLVPCLSIYINIQLMVHITAATWIYLLIWTLIGILVFFICLCLYKQYRNQNVGSKIMTNHHEQTNGKSPVSIIIESPTPTDTSKNDSDDEIKHEPDIVSYDTVKNKETAITEDVIVQNAVIDLNEEKEATIIDLLDKVIQAEEESYKEIQHNELKKEGEETKDKEILRNCKSLSELSDAGSEASMGNSVLSKYDVVAQVHREDLPKVSEESNEHSDNTELDSISTIHTIPDYLYEELTAEAVTYFNQSESDSSGVGSESIDQFDSSNNVENVQEELPAIPKPPPFNENLFASPILKKAFTISHSRRPQIDDYEENKPRLSVNSNTSFDDSNITFGSSRQLSFMSKLNNIFQTKITNTDEEPPLQSRSLENIKVDEEKPIHLPRPQLLLDLHKELLSRDENVRQTESLEREVNNNHDCEENKENSDVKRNSDDISYSREKLKSKLENMFASGGPKPFKPTPKDNPPAPEAEVDVFKNEEMLKMRKVEKNDTLSRQKAKFSQVMNSFRLSLHQDDV